MTNTQRPITQKQIWAVRFFLDRERRIRDRALFDLAIDSKLRGCDLIKIRIRDLVAGPVIKTRATVVQQKTLGCYMFVFAVPFSARDGWDLVGFFDDSDFKDTFRHYFAAAQWTQIDLSDIEPVNPAPRLRFVRR